MNEQEVGSALDNALKEKRVKREELWVTSKLWNNAHAKKHVRPALEKSLRDLCLDYLDLFLIHWPVHFRPGVLFPRTPEEYLPWEAIALGETWQAMETLVEKGLCRHIGVCNFHQERLRELQELSAIPPAVNQIELHPYLQQREMIDFCREKAILLTAYSPLGSTDRPAGMKKADEPPLLTHPLIVTIAQNHGISPAQTLLAWALARGTMVIPKSVHPGRLRENLAAPELTLTEADVAAITSLESGYRFVDGAFFTSSGSPYTLTHLWG
jgi:alcohol dehydrogenase (NADP+)